MRANLAKLAQSLMSIPLPSLHINLHTKYINILYNFHPCRPVIVKMPDVLKKHNDIKILDSVRLFLIHLQL